MVPTLVHGESADCWVLDEFTLELWGSLVGDLPYDEVVPGIWRSHYPDGTPRPGTGSAAQRLREQDLDGVDAEVLFPPVHGPNFLRQIANKDKDAYLANISGYN